MEPSIVRIVYNNRLLYKILIYIRDYALPILMFPIILLIRIVSPFILIRTEPTYALRIGHFTENIDNYLSEKENGINRKSFDIFFHSIKISNYQLKIMWDRHPNLRISKIGMLIYYSNRFYPNSKKYEVNIWPRDVKDIFVKSNNHIKLNDSEELIALNSLSKMNISKDSKFVGMIARDSSFLNKYVPVSNPGKTHDYRNSNINNYLPAAKLLSSKGYFVLRMGAIVENKLNSNDPKVIDYANNGYRSDLLDVYISEKCRFFISGNAGFEGMPIIFRKPMVFVNDVPLQYVRGWYSNSLVIFKKHWLVDEKRFMTFSEIIKSGAGLFYHTEEYRNNKIELIENTHEEISDVVIEMDERLNGNWEINKEDEILQKKFWSLFPIDDENLNKVFRCKVGTKYLRSNIDLLE